MDNLDLSEMEPGARISWLYWMSRTPEERFAFGEYLRRLHYGYDDSLKMDKTVFEVVRFGEDDDG